MKKENIFGDNIGYVELLDLSRANMSQESRVEAVTRIASLSYGKDGSANPEKRYEALLTESNGKPATPFEFVPVLLDTNKRITHNGDGEYFDEKYHRECVKYGEYVFENGKKYLLTNLRAYLNNGFSSQFFNTEEECEIIAKHFKVFKFKTDLSTARQIMRHRVSWQEVSRRYTTGEKMPFEFYVNKEIKALSQWVNQKLQDDIMNSLAVYEHLISKGIKPQEARRVLSQAMYTTYYGAFMPSQLNNFIALRSDSHTQWEARQVSDAMKELINE